MGKRDEAAVALGEDWVAPDGSVEAEFRTERQKRRYLASNRSPLGRKIITVNLVSMLVLVTGILYLNPFRESLVFRREEGLAAEAKLIANSLEAQLAYGSAAEVSVAEGAKLRRIIAGLDMSSELDLLVFDTDERIVATTLGAPRPPVDEVEGLRTHSRKTPVSDLLSAVWSGFSAIFSAPGSGGEIGGDDIIARARELAALAEAAGTRIETTRDGLGNTQILVAVPVYYRGRVVRVVVVTSDAASLDALVRIKREQVLQMFLIALLVSVALSRLLASSIANPLSDLAAAAELGRDRDARRLSPGRVRIPDLTARPDEIGRLSGAMRGMVAAMYDRIDANEQFAADVAHEIKNPLASLRSAVGTLRIAKRDDQRERLLEVIEHDVRRLDRLVSDISNASRLDSELVKEEEQRFDLLKMLGNIATNLAKDAEARGTDFIADLPAQPIFVLGLEARLAQVFVNIIANAISFCEEGDAVRVWTRQRDDRVLVVVEDTGPGIPDQALATVFKRFYSERPVGQFGNHSGLGLAISKQIVEAHGGVIWAENIRAPGADTFSDPLGARFVVGLPL